VSTSASSTFRCCDGRSALVLQECLLVFRLPSGTTLPLGDKDVTDEMIWHAWPILWAPGKFIEKLPAELDYNVMERGATLSVGQRQLLSFIRAMVYDPRHPLLDESHIVDRHRNGRNGTICYRKNDEEQNSDSNCTQAVEPSKRPTLLSSSKKERSGKQENTINCCPRTGIIRNCIKIAV